MDIEQEVSDVVATTTSGIDSPTIRTRKISSSIAVQSGETVALGGLIKDRNLDTKVGLPLLHKIPVLGALFGRTEQTVVRTELLVLLTPRVAGSQSEARSITEELRRRMRNLDPLIDRVKLDGPAPTSTPDTSSSKPTAPTPAQQNIVPPPAKPSAPLTPVVVGAAPSQDVSMPRQVQVREAPTSQHSRMTRLGAFNWLP